MTTRALLLTRWVTLAMAMGGLSACSALVRINASPNVLYPVMLNAGKTLDGNTVSLSGGREYKFSDSLLNIATQSTTNYGNVSVTTSTTSFSRSTGNADSHYKAASQDAPKSILVQRVRCSMYFMITLGAAMNRGLCEVDGRAHVVAQAADRQLPMRPVARLPPGRRSPDPDGPDPLAGNELKRSTSSARSLSDPVRPPLQVASPGPRKAGLALTITGSLAALTGAGLLIGGAVDNASAQAMMPPFFPNYPGTNPGLPYTIAGGVVLGVGAAMTLTGAILLAKYRPKELRGGQAMGDKALGARLALSPAGLRF